MMLDKLLEVYSYVWNDENKLPKIEPSEETEMNCPPTSLYPGIYSTGIVSKILAIVLCSETA
jgi:hypothetical protein